MATPTEQYDQDIIIVEDELLRAGFTQIPNILLRRPDLSAGAKLTYIGLLSYAWQQGSCYPGQDRLADDLGIGKRSVVRHLQELRSAGLLNVKRRGLRKTNVYVLLRLAGVGHASASRKCQNGTSRNANLALLEVPKRHTEEDSFEEDSRKEDSDFISNDILNNQNVDNSQRHVPSQASHSPTGEDRPRPHTRTTKHRADVERDESRPVGQAMTRPTPRQERRGTGMSTVRDVLQQQTPKSSPDGPTVPRERPTAARSTPRDSVVAPRTETARETTPKGPAGDTGTPSSSRRGRPPKAPPYIVAVMEDVSFKLHDEHPTSSLTRVMRLLTASGLEEPTFVEVLYRARSIARQQGNVQRRMPYWFSVLEDLLGLKDAPPNGRPIASGPGATSE